MEQDHRNKILNNLDRLVQYTKYDVLVEACLEHQLLFRVMVDRIQLAPTQEERHRQLFEKITHRGPRAFEVLSRILQLHFPDAHEILTHVSYRMRCDQDEPSIRQLKSELFNNATNTHVNNNVNNNINHSINHNNHHFNNHTNSINNNNIIDINDIQFNPMPSTSRSLAPRIREITNRLTQSNLGNIIRISPRKPQIVEFKERINPELHVKVQSSTQFHGETASKVGIYPMHSEKRGILIVVNNIHFRNKDRRRNGAETDRDNLVYVFREMGFFICVQEDLTKSEFLDFLKHIVQFKEIQDYDCFVFAVLSHGEHNEVEFVDGGKIEVEDILTKFNNFNCQLLLGKPKIFLFPFCRGPLADHGVIRKTTELEITGNLAEGINVPTFSDMKMCFSTLPGLTVSRDPVESSWSSLSENEGTRRFTESDSQASSNEPGPSTKRDNIATFYDMKICYSTVSGYNAFRDPVEGSWYIQILCKVFAEHAHDTHLEDLLKIVGEQMNVKRTELDHLQTVSNEDRGFNKNLYFNPGFYGCENQ